MRSFGIRIHEGKEGGKKKEKYGLIQVACGYFKWCHRGLIKRQ
jgi:hypothetical protein